MGEVVDFPGITKLDLNPDKLLTKAIDELSEVVIIGYDKTGEFYFASSKADGSAVLWLLELAKTKLIRIGLNE